MAEPKYGTTIVDGVEYINNAQGQPTKITAESAENYEGGLPTGTKAASDAAALGIKAVKPVNWSKIYRTIAKTNLKLFPEIASTATETALKTGFLTDEAMFGQIEKYFPGTMENIGSANAAIDDLLAGQIPAATTQEIMRTSAETAEISGIGPSPLAYSGALENIGLSSMQGIELGITASQNMAKLGKSMVFDYGNAALNYTNMLTDKTLLTPAEAIRAEQFNSSLALDKAVSILNYTFDQQKLESQKRMFRTAQRKETQRAIIEGAFGLAGDIAGSKDDSGGGGIGGLISGIGSVFDSVFGGGDDSGGGKKPSGGDGRNTSLTGRKGTGYLWGGDVLFGMRPEYADDPVEILL